MFEPRDFSRSLSIDRCGGEPEGIVYKLFVGVTYAWVMGTLLVWFGAFLFNFDPDFFHRPPSWLIVSTWPLVVMAFLGLIVSSWGMQEELGTGAWFLAPLGLGLLGGWIYYTNQIEERTLQTGRFRKVIMQASSLAGGELEAGATFTVAPDESVLTIVFEAHWYQNIVEENGLYHGVLRTPGLMAFDDEFLADVIGKHMYVSSVLGEPQREGNLIKAVVFVEKHTVHLGRAYHSWRFRATLLDWEKKVAVAREEFSGSGKRPKGTLIGSAAIGDHYGSEPWDEIREWVYGGVHKVDVAEQEPADVESRGGGVETKSAQEEAERPPWKSVFSRETLIKQGFPEEVIDRLLEKGKE